MKTNKRGISGAIRNFLQDEERAYRILIDTSAVLLVVGFLVAVAAILLMK